MALVTDKQALGIAAVVAVGLFLVWRKLPAVGEALNPTSRENLAYKGVNAVGETLTGDQHWTLGGWLYDITHQDEAERLGLGMKSDTAGGG